ncbi:tetratricopeptide repeat protein [Sinomicrobium pectinilyticum]|nr:tetratricopeptide repeat protein [Sinomicrobium pectinilyticum]
MNRIAGKVVGLCTLMFIMVCISASGQDTTTYKMPEIFTKMLNNPGYQMDEVDKIAYEHHWEWFGKRAPDWTAVRTEFSRKYPEMNIDSLTHRARFIYFHILVGEHGREEDQKNRVKELAYLANTYGTGWDPHDLLSYAGSVIKFDFGYDADAFRWIQMALEKIKKMPQVHTPESGGYYIEAKASTLASILAKMGRKEEALKYIAEALPFYSTDGLYLEMDGTYGQGLYKKRAMSNLFEVLADRGRWLGIDQKKVLYKGKVNFKEDKRYWHELRDNYLKKEFPAREADSLMYIGAEFYYRTYVQDTVAWAKPFVEYAETYGNVDAQHKNQNAWELFIKSNQPEILEKALEWSKETLGKKDDPNRYAYLDTYANLHYKLGNTAEALEMINKAIVLAPENQKAAFEETREKMRKGKKTW